MIAKSNYLLGVAATVVLTATNATSQHQVHRVQPQTPAAEQPGLPAKTDDAVEVSVSVAQPRLGAAQDRFGPSITLGELQKTALENNPTLRQAAAEVRSAEGRRRQAGLWPNPRVGYTGEEIRGGSFGGGQHGFFFEQDIILGGKLALGQRVFSQEKRIAEVEAEEQRLRVLNAVKLAFYSVLASQDSIDTFEQLARLANDNLETAGQLQRLGQLDESEVLQANIERHRAELAVIRQRNMHRRLWSELAAVVGRPGLTIGTLPGRLDETLPAFNEDELLQQLLTQSPAVRIAQANVSRAEAGLDLARRVPVPDLSFRGGVQQNRELLEAANKRVGVQGFVELGVQVPLFNRNQGNVQSSVADLTRAREEARRVELVLRERASALVRNYHDASETVARYQKEILPSAQRAHELMLTRWGQMAASYPQVLNTQRLLFEVHAEYIQALQQLWTNSISFQGFLLTDGLEAPARPSEVDLPIREINLPSSTVSPGRE